MENFKTIYNIVITCVIIILISATFYVYQNRNKLKVLTVIDLQKVGIKIPDNQKIKTSIDSSYNKNDFANANKLIDSQLANDQNNIQLLLTKANTLAQEASLTFREKELGKQAMPYVDQVLNLDPNNVQALTLKGYIYEIQQDYADAHKYYDLALAIDSKNDEALAHKGHAFFLEGKVEDAKNASQQALAINNQNDLANFTLGKIIFLTNQSESGKYFKAVLLHSNNVRVQAESAYSLGEIALYQKDLNLASQYMDQAASFDPTFALALVGKGVIAFNKAMNQTGITFSEKQALVGESVTDLQKALDLNHNQTLAIYQLGVETAAFGDLKNAKIILQKANETISKDISLSANEKISFANLVDSALTFVSKNNK